MLVRRFPGLTGESGEDEQTGRAALLGLDMDMDMDQQAAQRSSVLVRKRLRALLLCGPAGTCARCWSGDSLELGQRTTL